METSSKTRTPSRCREWERQRRNKFNDAIIKLGEAVRAVNKIDDTAGKDSENVQYPKIEIVQKAIACLTNCAQEKTQMKAEILALQVKLDADKNKHLESRKDVSTQVHYGFNKKTQNSKHSKVVAVQKSKRNALKEKPNAMTNNVTIESKPDKKLPMLLPRAEISDKKRAENTIVVLPAAPYLYPQRPLFLPAVPPAFVIVDPNMQSLNKSPLSLVSRNGDVTKTTMVNILPISAYSRPLSATKSKKTNSKPKGDSNKKVKKKSLPTKVVKGSTISKGKTAEHDLNSKTDKINEKKSVDANTETTLPEKITEIKSTSVEVISIDKNDKGHQVKAGDIPNVPQIKEVIDVPKEIEKSSSSNSTDKLNLNENQKVIPQLQETPTTITPNKNEDDCVKQTAVEDKDKENKLPNILDTTLCENGVDGGNARLELAEEFLAASPTAAFLMSFPLVSGNRADSPAEETTHTGHHSTKDSAPLPTTPNIPPPPVNAYFDKSTTEEIKPKIDNKQSHTSSNIPTKQSVQQKYVHNNVINKATEVKTSSSIPVANVSTENPFLTLSMPSIVTTTALPDTFGLDFECNLGKSMPNPSSSYVSNSNLFYKSDPFSTVKNTIYSTSSIASGHEFNSLGLYPCAMEKYGKTKADYTNVEDNLMKMGSSRLTYDIDLGWSHKGFDFVNCTTSTNTFSKDILTTATAPSYSSSYNPFNPEFHMPLVSSSNKKDISSKPVSSFSDTITSFYSSQQPANLWSDDMCFYTNNNVSKTITNKHQNYLPLDQVHSNTNVKPVTTKQYETKHTSNLGLENNIKSNENIRQQSQQVTDKYTKKSPSKMHINWMTSELRPMQNNCNPPQTNIKETQKQSYGQLAHTAKKSDHTDNSYFPPIAIHNFTTQPTQEEFQVWPSARPLGTTEISIEPPPINLPTLVGDLALGPHDKKKNADATNRAANQADMQNCGNFLSVTQLMNRSTDNISSRYQGPSEASKSAAKQSAPHFDNNRKIMSSRLESNVPQLGYIFNDSKSINSYENAGQFSQPKPKANKNDKNTKAQKHSYSAEALIRGGTCTQKVQDQLAPKFMTSTPKYSDYNSVQDTGVAQVSHFPPILDYTDNNYASQQFSGTTLYNSTTNTISNSFYSNFMSGSANIMSGNYSSAPFTGEFIDYNQAAECNYTNNKYEEFKMRSNPPTVFQEKNQSNYKSSRRESTAKHKLECSKKESSKKYQNKRPKLSGEVEEWSDASHLFWQNKPQAKKHANMMSEDFPFPNYVGNQMPTQYQHDFFNSHLVPSNMQAVGHNADRTLASFPATSRANFNLSTIFPEITMKVQ